MNTTMRKVIYLLALMLLVNSCTSTRGYDYEAHKKRGQKAADYYRKGGGCKRKH